MTLTIDNAYNSKIISNNDASIDIVDVESRKLLFVGAIVVVTEGPKAGVWAVIKVNPRSVPTLTYQGVRSRMDRV